MIRFFRYPLIKKIDFVNSKVIIPISVYQMTDLQDIGFILNQINLNLDDSPKTRYLIRDNLLI